MPRNKPSTDPDYGAVHVRQLRAGIKRGLMSGEYRDLVIAAGAAIDFLNRRLTDAAKAGCHHCDEGEAGTPCRWCGLKTNKRLKGGQR